MYIHVHVCNNFRICSFVSNYKRMMSYPGVCVEFKSFIGFMFHNVCVFVMLLCYYVY
jgi:hypothetical protein